MHDKLAYSEPEAAKLAGISRTRLRKEIRPGRLTAKRVGKRMPSSSPTICAPGWTSSHPSHGRKQANRSLRRCPTPENKARHRWQAAPG